MNTPASPGSELRQGDICALDYFPVWDLRTASPVGGALAGKHIVSDWTRAIQVDDKYLVMVLTQCCDLQNPRGRSGVAVAALMKVPQSPGSDGYKAIMDSAERDAEGVMNYVNFFPLQVQTGDARSGGDAVVDFSTITTITPADLAVVMLQDARLQESDVDLRTKLRHKLAFSLGRTPEEDSSPEDQPER